MAGVAAGTGGTAKGPTPVEALTHADKRVNIPTADARDLVDPALSAPVPLRYPATPLSTRSWCGPARTGSVRPESVRSEPDRPERGTPGMSTGR